MIVYLLKRALFFIPSLIAVSLLAFLLSKLTPGDPIFTLNKDIIEGSGFANLEEEEKVYTETARLLGLDKPAFYFAIHSQAFPDTLYRIYHELKRENLRKLVGHFANWKKIQTYYLHLQRLDKRLFALPDSLTSQASKEFTNTVRDLYFTAAPEGISTKFEQLQAHLSGEAGLEAFVSRGFADLNTAKDEMFDHSQRWKLFIPAISWYGVDNQYHHWLLNFLRGDFGQSYIDGRPVAQKILSPLKLTLLMNIIAILVAYGISIPLGVRMAVQKGRRFDQVSTFILFLLYSLPTFWIGTLLIIFVTNPEYGMDWFPTYGISSLPEDAPFWSRFWDVAYHLVLPVFCLTYGALAFISRQMRNSTDRELNKLYTLAARARGLSFKQATWRHAFRNALFPIVTLLASIFPSLLAGSFVIEYIFNIPGMGLTTINAINNSDWPVVYAILMLSSVFTIIGILVADVLYAWLNPRVSY